MENSAHFQEECLRKPEKRNPDGWHVYGHDKEGKRIDRVEFKHPGDLPFGMNTRPFFYESTSSQAGEDKRDAEFELHVDGVPEVTVSGPRHQAEKEILHYLAQLPDERPRRAATYFHDGRRLCAGGGGVSEFKPTGNPELDAVLVKPDPEFAAFRDSLPPNYWARYDLSAVRLGWHFGKLAGQAAHSAGADGGGK